MRRIYVDTSVLFPFSVMDLFLALAEDHVHQVMWTDELLEEWGRVIVREHHRSPESATSITDAIREFFDDSRIDPALYCDRIVEMPGPDPDDHAHSAAAIAGGAGILITWDKNGFPAEALRELGLQVTDPGGHLSRRAVRRPRRPGDRHDRRLDPRCSPRTYSMHSVEQVSPTSRGEWPPENEPATKAAATSGKWDQPIDPTGRAPQ